MAAMGFCRLALVTDTGIESVKAYAITLLESNN